MASRAMNAPTVAVAPFRTLRRVAPPSPGGVVPLLSISPGSPPLASLTRDHDALDQHPHDGQPAERENVRADTGRQDTAFVLSRNSAWRRRLDTGLRGSNRLRRRGCHLCRRRWFARGGYSTWMA